MKGKIVVVTCVVNSLLLVFSISLLPKACGAEDKYPSRAIEIFAPTPPGSYSDLINRILAKKFEKYLNTLVIPGNKAGGGDMVAATALANAAPDGYTLALLADGPLIYSHMLGRATFSREDIRVVGQLFCTTIVMDVSADSPWNTFQEFAEYAHKNPGLTYSHIGIGSSTWVRAEYLNTIGNLRMRGVPFAGVETIQALLGKHVSAAFTDYGTAKNQAGKVRILFSFSPPGLSPEPDLPTIPSVFGKDIMDIAPPSNHLAAPGKTPENVIKILEAVLEKISKDPEFIGELKRLYADICFLNSGATRLRHEEKSMQFKPIFQRAGLMK